MYFYFQMTKRFSADDQVKHCLFPSFTCVLHVLSGLHVESKTTNMESDGPGSGFAHQIRLGGGDSSAVAGRQSRRDGLPRAFKKSIYQAFGFYRMICERGGSGLCLARSFYAKKGK